MRILLVEDDAIGASYLVRGLNECGHCVDHAGEGDAGLDRALAGGYDVLIIDRMLPHRDGLSIVRTLRAADDDTPVLLLSALGEVDDRVAGLRAGGDDYLVKPYAFQELLARIEALVRRTRDYQVGDRLEVADLVIDVAGRTAVRAGRVLHLQPREFALLEYLVRHAGQVVTRTMLLENVWGYHFDPRTNLIDVHVSRLRAKVDKDFAFPLIHTVRGAGYKLQGSEGGLRVHREQP